MTVVQVIVFSFTLIGFMPYASAGLLEEQIALLLGETEASIKQSQAQVYSYMRQLCDARLIQILPVADKPEGEWPLVMSRTVAEAVVPSRESLPEEDRDAEEKQKTNNPDYCTKITLKDFVALLESRETFKPWIEQRLKIYRAINSVIVECQKRQLCICKKYGSEAMRDYLVNNTEAQPGSLPVSDNVNVLCNGGSSDDFLKLCEEHIKPQNIECTLSYRNSLLFTFPVICKHHGSKADVSFSHHKISFNLLPRKVSLPLPALHVAFSFAGIGCNDFTFLSDIEIIVTSLSRGLSHSLSSKYTDRDLLMRTCCPDVPEFKKIRPLTSPPLAASWALALEADDAWVTVTKSSPFMELCSAATAKEIKALEQKNKQLMDDVNALKVTAEIQEQDFLSRLNKSAGDIAIRNSQIEVSRELHCSAESKVEDREKTIQKLQETINDLKKQNELKEGRASASEKKLKIKYEQVSNLSIKIKELEKKIKHQRQEVISELRAENTHVLTAVRKKSKKTNRNKAKSGDGLREEGVVNGEVSDLNKTLCQEREERRELERIIVMHRIFSCCLAVLTSFAAGGLFLVGYLGYQHL